MFKYTYRIKKKQDQIFLPSPPINNIIYDVFRKIKSFKMIFLMHDL